MISLVQSVNVLSVAGCRRHLTARRCVGVACRLLHLGVVGHMAT